MPPSHDVATNLLFSLSVDLLQIAHVTEPVIPGETTDMTIEINGNAGHFPAQLGKNQVQGPQRQRSPVDTGNDQEVVFPSPTELSAFGNDVALDRVRGGVPHAQHSRQRLHIGLVEARVVRVVG